MTKGTRNVIAISLAFLLFLALGGYYLGNIFGRAYTPPDINVSLNEISSSGGFMDPITIEKLKVDSIGKEQRPVKYVIEYVATCTINQKQGEPPVALDQVEFNEAGRYSWSEEKVNISIFHSDGFTNRIGSPQRAISSGDNQKYPICPLKFEKGNWYFINFHDPVFIGVYVFIDNAGLFKRVDTYSGESLYNKTVDN